jgi:hypothetical protein
MMLLIPAHLQPNLAHENGQTSQIFFSSTLSYSYYDALEALMFFNPQQGKFRNAVSQLVERYGNPKIIKERGLLRLEIGSEVIAQTLFSFDRPQDGELIGVVAYLRESIEHLAIIHLAVKDEYSISGCYRDRLLVLHLIQKVQEIGSRLKGVESIQILYDRSHRKIPVRHLATKKL